MVNSSDLYDVPKNRMVKQGVVSGTFSQLEVEGCWYKPYPSNKLSKLIS